MLLNTWHYVGFPGITAGVVHTANNNLAISPSGQPFLAYVNLPNSGKITVNKFDGTNWVVIGSPGSTYSGDYSISMAFSPSGQLYLAFADSVNSYKATVMMYDGTGWTVVGQAGFSSGAGEYFSMGYSPLGQPYLAFVDIGVAMTYLVRVMKFDGTNWVDVGPTAISEGPAWVTSLAFNPSGQPYVSYTDLTYSWGTVVKKFDGTNWVFVGTPGFITNNWSFGEPLVINSFGEPYIEYENSANEISVMKFDGTQWVYVGPQWFSGSVGWNITMAISPTDQLYVAFSADANSNKATVMVFDGVDWVPVGTPGFTPERALYISLAIDPSGIPYLSFVDSAYLNKISVMKYDSAYLGINEHRNSAFSVYPNPASTLLTIDLTNINSVEKQVEIYSVDGKKIAETGTRENKINLNVQNYTSGVYFIKVKTNIITSLGKFCKE